MARRMLLLLVVALFGAGAFAQCDISSAATGDWQTPATWVGGAVPGANCNVTIAAGHTVTLTASVDQGSGVVMVAGTATLAVGANSLAMGSVGTVAAGSGTSTVSVAAGGSLNCNDRSLNPAGAVHSGLTLSVSLAAGVVASVSSQVRGTLSFAGSSAAAPALVGGVVSGTVTSASNAVDLGSVRVERGATLPTDTQGPIAGTSAVFDALGAAFAVTLKGFAGRATFVDASGTGSASITLGTRSAATAVLALEVNAAVSGEMQGAVSVAASRTLNAGALVVPTQLAISGPGSIDSSSAALTFTAGSTLTVSGGLVWVTNGQVGGSGVLNLTDVTITHPFALGGSVSAVLGAASPTTTFYAVGASAAATTPLLSALTYNANTLRVSGTSGGSAVVQAGVLSAASSLLTEGPKLLLSGGGWKGTVGGVGAQAVELVAPCSVAASSQLTLVGPNTGSAGAFGAVYTGELQVPTGAAVQLGVTGGLTKGPDFRQLFIIRSSTAAIVVGTCTLRNSTLGAPNLGFSGPIAGASATFDLQTRDQIIPDIQNWAGTLIVDDSGTAFGPFGLSVSSAAMVGATATAVPRIQRVGSAATILFFTLAVTDRFTSDGTPLYLRTSLTSSSGNTSLPYMLLDGGGQIATSLCAVHCTFARLEADASASIQVPANGVITVNDASSNLDGVLSLGTNAILNLNGGRLSGSATLAAGAVVNCAGTINPASASASILGAGTVVLLNGATLGPNLQYASGPVFSGPASGASVSITSASFPSALSGWAGTVVVGGAVGAVSIDIHGITALASATLRLDQFLTAASFNATTLPVGATIDVVATSAVVTVRASRLDVTYTGTAALTFVAGGESLSYGRLPSISLTSLVIDSLATFVLTSNSAVAANSLVLRAGSSLRTDAAVVGTVAVSTPDANFDTSNQNYGQADIRLHGVRVNTTLVWDFLPGHALLNVKLSGGAGIAADSFNIDYSVFTNNSAVVTIATTDSSALVGVASNTVTGMFTTASATLGTVTVNACVTGPGTLDASVSITALSQCAADNLFAGCNAVACNAAGSGRASCVATRSAHTCTCNLGFEGTECQTNLNECASMPCANGASCVDGNNGFTCACVPGYSGVLCQTEIDECSSNPCQNGGSCSERLNGYVCQCVAGWSGNNCQTNFNECGSTPCQNGGSCTDALNGYSCACVAGFTGSNCQTNINECASNPCPGISQCVDGVNGFTCVAVPCPTAVQGLNCSGHGFCQAVSGLCSCDLSYGGSDCNSAPAALPDTQLELVIATYSGQTTLDAIAAAVGLSAGSVTLVSTRPGAAAGTTVLLVSFGTNSAAASSFAALVANGAPAVSALTVTSARSTSGVVGFGSASNSGPAKPPVSEGAAIGIVMAALIVLVIILSVVWYFCSKARDEDMPKTRASSGSSASPPSVELQVR